MYSCFIVSVSLRIYRTDTFIGRKGQVFLKSATAEGEESEVPADSLSLFSTHWRPTADILFSRRVQNDLEYVVQVKIGTPSVTLNLASFSSMPVLRWSYLSNWWLSRL